MQSPQILQGIKTINEDMSVQNILLFCGNEGPLVCYYTVRTLEEAFVGKAQVVLEGRDHCSMSVPEGKDIAAGRPARNGSRTDKQTHKNHTHTCSQCNL